MDVATAAPYRPVAFHHIGRGRVCPPVAKSPQVDALLARDSVVAIGVSGGKDSDACAIAVSRHLDALRHQGPRVLVHADLGRVEWKDSLPACERLAAHLGWELMVVKRQAGDMLARWQGRWAANVARYEALDCVRIILPWSTPSMRFCTSELKVAVITSALKKRFPGQDIVNVAGIRRQESAARSRMPVSAAQPKLERRGLAGVTWNAIIDWQLEDVLDTLADARLQLHEAYTRFHASRVSCAFCIMSSIGDLQAAASCPDNRELYREMVDLELTSSFAFQGSRWLADLRPDWLDAGQTQRVSQAKRKAALRAEIESEIPDHLLFCKKGWPTALPSMAEAALLASVRERIGALLDLQVAYTDALSIRARYAQLMHARQGQPALAAA